ncbi:MAG: DUF883 C-terminal domain-containing protein [Pseudomonadota bacterium]|nr:DUF883 C-terminal domain-containing protein [Pseudomonadota bacterium]
MTARAETLKTATRNSSGDAEDLAAQVEALRDDLSRLTSTVGRLTRSGISDAQTIAKEKVGEARDAAMQSVGEVEDMVRRNPLQAALIAIGLGFLIGALSRR